MSSSAAMAAASQQAATAGSDSCGQEVNQGGHLQRVLSQDRVFVFANALARGDAEEVRAQVRYFSSAPVKRGLSGLTWGLSHERLSGGCSPLHVAALTDNVELGSFLIDLAESLERGSADALLEKKSEATAGLAKSSFRNLKTDTTAVGSSQARSHADGRACSSMTQQSLSQPQSLLATLDFLRRIGVNAPAHDGSRAIHWAARAGHIKFGRLLLDRGANAHAVDCRGATALHVAAFHDRAAFAKMLLDQAPGAFPACTVNCPSTTTPQYSCANRGSTPLHYACGNPTGCADVVPILLAHPLADTEIRDNAGRLALDIVQGNLEREQESVRRALKQLKEEEAKLKAAKARVEGSNKRLKELQRAHGSSGEATAKGLLREAMEEVDEGVADVKNGSLFVQQLKQKIDTGKDGIVKMKAVIAQVVNKTLSLERQQERQDMKYQTLFEQALLKSESQQLRAGFNAENAVSTSGAKAAQASLKDAAGSKVENSAIEVPVNDNRVRLEALRAEQERIAKAAAAVAGELEGSQQLPSAQDATKTTNKKKAKPKKSKKQKSKKKKQRKKKKILKRKKAKRRGDGQSSDTSNGIATDTDTSDADSTAADSSSDDPGGGADQRFVPAHLRGKLLSIGGLKASLRRQKGLSDEQQALVLEAALGEFDIIRNTTTTASATPGNETALQSARNNAVDGTGTGDAIDDLAHKLAEAGSPAPVDYRVFKLAMQLVAFIQSGRNLDVHRNPFGQFGSDCMLRTEMDKLRLPMLDRM